MLRVSVNDALGVYEPVKTPKWFRNEVLTILQHYEPLHLKLGLNPGRVGFVKEVYGDGCACYASETSPWPVYALVPQSYIEIPNRLFQTSVSIVHELCHAFLEYNGLDTFLHDENKIEKIACKYCYENDETKFIRSLKKLLNQPL